MKIREGKPKNPENNLFQSELVRREIYFKTPSGESEPAGRTSGVPPRPQAASYVASCLHAPFLTIEHNVRIQTSLPKVLLLFI
jgi:hypothetical protein